MNKVNSSSGIDYNGEPANGYTNYELWKLKNNREFLNKTIFYKNNKVVENPFK